MVDQAPGLPEPVEPAAGDEYHGQCAPDPGGGRGREPPPERERPPQSLLGSGQVAGSGQEGGQVAERGRVVRPGRGHRPVLLAGLRALADRLVPDRQNPGEEVGRDPRAGYLQLGFGRLDVGPGQEQDDRHARLRGGRAQLTGASERGGGLDRFARQERHLAEPEVLAVVGRPGADRPPGRLQPLPAGLRGVPPGRPEDGELGVGPGELGVRGLIRESRQHPAGVGVPALLGQEVNQPLDRRGRRPPGRDHGLVPLGGPVFLPAEFAQFGLEKRGQRPRRPGRRRPRHRLTGGADRAAVALPRPAGVQGRLGKGGERGDRAFEPCELGGERPGPGLVAPVEREPEQPEPGLGFGRPGGRDPPPHPLGGREVAGRGECLAEER